MQNERIDTSTDDAPTVMLPRPAPVSTLRRPGARRNVAEYREFQDGELIPGTRYRVLQLIGVGGMGSVYEVEHIELGKRFVLKALLRELARREDLVIRLRNEWRALGRLEHPSLVTVTDAGTSASGVPYYVMERLDGETLAQRMRRLRRCPVRESVLIAAGVLEGLAAAHEIGVVHRDVKPPNIFILPDGRPKVLDFGVAKILDDPGVVTARGVAVGTPRYMSPEQARGEPVDGRSDIYSVGLILFEMIAGVSPFDDAHDANELILAHLARQAPRLSTLAMEVPPELDGLVLRMLAKPRTARPDSAKGAARALREIADGLTQGPSHLGASGFALQLRRETTGVPKGGARDTTRPDGVAVKEHPTQTLAGDVLLDPSILFQSMASAEATSPSLRAVVTSLGSDTIISSPPTLSADMPTPNVDGLDRTEMLTAHGDLDAAATRTSLPSPSTPSVPPSSMVESQTTEPPVHRSGVPRLAVLGASLVLFGIVLALALWLRSPAAPDQSAVAINPAVADPRHRVAVSEDVAAEKTPNRPAKTADSADREARSASRAELATSARGLDAEMAIRRGARAPKAPAVEAQKRVDQSARRGGIVQKAATPSAAGNEPAGRPVPAQASKGGAASEASSARKSPGASDALPGSGL